MSSLVDVVGYLPRVTVRDGRVLEQALAGQTLFQPGVELAGAVIEAVYANSGAPLLQRLADRCVPRLVDPQTLRLVSDSFRSVGQLAELPYAPAAPLAPDSVDADALRVFVGSILDFESEHGATDYLAPAIPVFDDGYEHWLGLHERTLEESTRANGIRGRARKPLIATLAPGRKALREPSRFVEHLADLPLDGVYVQPLALAPTRDSVDKLITYVRFLESVRTLRLPVTAGRIGAFGLILEAVDVPMFDSGLGVAEGFSLASLNGAAVRVERARGDAQRGSRRVYLRALKTTVAGRVAAAILNERGLRSSFACELECCRWRTQETLGERCREHYLRVRQDEVGLVAASPTRELRLARVHDELVEARDLAAVVTRALRKRGAEPPSFAHLDRWLSVVATLSEMSAAA
jgi:hypothetical protein